MSSVGHHKPSRHLVERLNHLLSERDELQHARADRMLLTLQEPVGATSSSPTRPDGRIGRWGARAVRLHKAAVVALGDIPEAVRYAEEWEYDMAQLQSGWARFRFACSLRLFAARQIRRAVKVRAPAD